MTTEKLKSHGILMSGVMMRAWLAGSKNQTRRTRGLDYVNNNPDDWEFLKFEKINVKKTSDGKWISLNDSISQSQANGKLCALFSHKNELALQYISLPYGMIGDELWFKETWKMFERDDDGRDFLHFRADDAKVDPTWWTEEDWTGPNPKWSRKNVFHKWQSSMMMPKMCARIHVPITGVRVERLQEISVEDVIAEGIAPHTLAKGILSDDAPDPRWKYFELWDQLNGKKMPFIMNPFVFVYEFKKNIISKKTEV